jgi:hypothetical protein
MSLGKTLIVYGPGVGPSGLQGPQGPAGTPDTAGSGLYLSGTIMGVDTSHLTSGLAVKWNGTTFTTS